MLKAERYNQSPVPKHIEILIFIAVFVSSITFFKEPFEGYLHYVIFLALLPFFFFRFGFPSIIVKILLLPLLVGTVNVFLGNCESFSFIKVFGGLLLSLFFFYYVYLYYDRNIKLIFERYVKWSYWICLIGLFQVVSYIIGFRYGYDYSWILNKWGIVQSGILGIRVNSIFSEASQFAIVMAPAVYVSIYNLLHKKSFGVNKIQSLLILASVFLSTSSTGYLGILLSFLLASDGIRFRYVVFGAVFLMIAFNLLYNNVFEFRLRVDSAIALWVDQDFAVKNTNTSSFVLYNNYYISTSTFMEHPIFGTGLGSHELAYEKYSLTNNMLAYKEGFSFNKSDANSLLLRLMSETGLVGMVFMLLILIKGFIGKQYVEELIVHRIVGQACFIIIIMYLMRQGNYFINGFPLFVMLYYFNKLDANRIKREMFQKKQNLVSD